LSVLGPCSHFQLKRLPAPKEFMTLCSVAINIIRMKDLLKEAVRIHVFRSESAELKSYPIRVQRGAIGGENDNYLANRIDDRAKVLFTSPQLLLGLLAIIDVDGSDIPAQDLAWFGLQRVVLKEVPTISAVLVHRAHFQLEWNALREAEAPLFLHPNLIVGMA